MSYKQILKLICDRLFGTSWNSFCFDQECIINRNDKTENKQNIIFLFCHAQLLPFFCKYHNSTWVNLKMYVKARSKLQQCIIKYWKDGSKLYTANRFSMCSLQRKFFTLYCLWSTIEPALRVVCLYRTTWWVLMKYGGKVCTITKSYKK